MKYFKLFLLSAAALVAFSSCNQEEQYQWGPQDPSEKDEVYFATSVANEELEPAQNIYTITVSRVNTTGALNVPIIVVNNQDNVFTVPASVDFNAGAKTAKLDIDISKMELETKYELEIELPSDFYYLYKKGTENGAKGFHLICIKQKWNDAGTCTFTDYTWFEEPATVDNIPIQNHEGTMDYRMIAPYNALSPDDFDAVNIIFQFDPSVTPDAEKGVTQVTIEDGIYDIWKGVGYQMYFDAANYGKYCYILQSDNKFLVSCLLVKGSSVYTGGGFAFTWTGMPTE